MADFLLAFGIILAVCSLPFIAEYLCLDSYGH